jgi:hypothetical protein
LTFTLAWLDSSENERRRALDVIDLFEQSETVDELGIGSVRDTIADILSPGTSTVQTRARYFFFVPWAYQKLEAKSFEAGGAALAVRRSEVSLIEALAQANDTSGAIGIQSGAKLQRFPSDLYWAGLSRLGIKLVDSSRAHYHRLMERGIGDVERDDSGDVSLEGQVRGTWHPQLPPAPEGFPAGATLDMTRAEAEFFSEQLRNHAPGSLLEFLVTRGEPVGETGLPWEHPAVGEMGLDLQRWLEEGRRYSELLSGAQLLYNYMLAEKKHMEKHLETYRTELEKWRETVLARRPIFHSWERPAFWARLKQRNSRLPDGVRQFSEEWIEQTLAKDDPDPIADADMRNLIYKREKDLKKDRARLFSQAHLDLWLGASSPEPLNYRWWITRRIVDDVVSGLKRTDS